jgi:hypothetical protein
MSTDSRRPDSHGTDSRREFLQTSGLGIGWLAALDLLNRPAAAGTQGPQAPRRRHGRQRNARDFLFMQGGPSQVDTGSETAAGKTPAAPPPLRQRNFQNGKPVSLLSSAQRTFKKYGQSGLEVSDLFLYVAQQATRLP